MANPVLVEVLRGAVVESRHRGAIAVVDPDGAAAFVCGDVDRPVFPRSAVKALQALRLIETGAADRYGLADHELALACASHGGEPEHVAIAQAMLEDIGLEEGDLACGPHDPLSSRGMKLLRESGARLTRLHNNCSGKHAAMLARAHTAGWHTYGYERRDHPVQRCSLKSVAHWAGLDEADVGQAIDGCGVVAFALPLENMARAWSRLARAVRDNDGIPSRIVHAMCTRPFLVGGTDRFDSVLIEETDGRAVAKIGAEGVHSIAVPEQGIGIAVKVDDGAQRAQFPAVIRILQMLDVLPASLPPRLDEFFRRPVRNTRGEVVGEIRLVH